MIPPSLEDALRVHFPDRPDLSIVPAGEGDYCRAFLVDQTWLFLLAKHPFASACLDRVARVLPLLAEDSPIPIPVVEHHGRGDGFTYVGYPCLPVTELSRERFRFTTLSPEHRLDLAETLGALFRHLHAFDPTEAVRLGVPISEYPFAMQDDHFLPGSAEELYRRDLGAFAAWPGSDEGVINRLAEELTEYREVVWASAQPLVLLHNEVSTDHFLHDPQTGRPTGIIDFNGMIVGRPTRDFLYLYGDYGPDFAAEVLCAYGHLPLGEAMDELRFLHLWHVLVRLLWAVDHGDGARAASLRDQLTALLTRPGT